MRFPPPPFSENQPQPFNITAAVVFPAALSALLTMNKIPQHLTLFVKTSLNIPPFPHKTSHFLYRRQLVKERPYVLLFTSPSRIFFLSDRSFPSVTPLYLERRDLLQRQELTPLLVNAVPPNFAEPVVVSYWRPFQRRQWFTSP